MSYNHTLTGITLVRQANRLGYPWKQCVKALTDLCDQVIINVDIHSDDGMLDDLKKLTSKNHQFYLSVWDMKNTGDGRMLANEANKTLPEVTSDWVIYLQADEMIHQQDMHSLRLYLDTLPSNTTQVELLRTYFWKDLNSRAPQYEIYLGRIFRKGTHTVGGDGMYLNRLKGEIIRSPYWIYHYSRMGPEEKVAARVKNLDQLFHDDVSVTKTFSYNEEPVLIPYTGTHPDGIEEFYRSFI